MFSEKQDKPPPLSLRREPSSRYWTHMIYGLLKIEVREKIPFHAVDTFSKLLSYARNDESAILEKKRNKKRRAGEN
jgi:hypothetical protein